MALPPPDDGSTALVTGASSGIGIELARSLAARGHNVIVTARRAEPLEALAGELSAAYRVAAVAMPCDLADAGQREGLIEKIAATGRRVEVLANNAAAATVGRFEELAGKRELEVVRVCAEAPVHLCETYVPAMSARGRGAVLNLASIAAFAPTPGMTTYASAKAFVLNFTLALRAEVARAGVTVSVLAPGAIRTGFAEQSDSEEIAKRIPEAFWRSPRFAAEAGIRGLERGEAVIVPGRFYRVASAISQHAPRRALVAIASRRFKREPVA